METKREAAAPDSLPTPDRIARTRRGFIGALATALGSALLIGLLWLISRRAPSAERDPHLTPPAMP